MGEYCYYIKKIFFDFKYKLYLNNWTIFHDTPYILKPLDIFKLH